MKSGQVQVIGIVTIVKDDKISYVVHGFTPFEDWEIEKGCEGYKTFRINRFDNVIYIYF